MGWLSKLLGEGCDGPPERAHKMGRNEKCWCGSNKKYKQCHHASDRRYFSKELAAACKSGG